VAGWRLTERLSLQGGVFNLLDETYWDWGNVGGLAETSAVKDRYSAPGRNAAAAVRLRW
jgi:hemoglobin/transferrin/lactoferrin receptor protein